MAANVHCTNDKIVVTRDGHQLTYCGWKGERFPSVPDVHGPGGAAEFERRATAKPCPRCGGKVVLIPPDAITAEVS